MNKWPKEINSHIKNNHLEILLNNAWSPARILIIIIFIIQTVTYIHLHINTPKDILTKIIHICLFFFNIKHSHTYSHTYKSTLYQIKLWSSILDSCNFWVNFGLFSFLLNNDCSDATTMMENFHWAIHFNVNLHKFIFLENS